MLYVYTCSKTQAYTSSCLHFQSWMTFKWRHEERHLICVLPLSNTAFMRIGCKVIIYDRTSIQIYLLLTLEVFLQLPWQVYIFVHHFSFASYSVIRWNSEINYITSFLFGYAQWLENCSLKGRIYLTPRFFFFTQRCSLYTSASVRAFK